MTWSNVIDTYKNPQCFTDRFVNVKNIDTIGDLDDTHDNDECNINSISVFMDKNKLDWDNVIIAINYHCGNNDDSFSSIDE